MMKWPWKVAGAAVLCACLVAPPARADDLVTFNLSATLQASPNASAPALTGSFTLDETTGDLDGFSIATPIGIFSNTTGTGVLLTGYTTAPNGAGNPVFILAADLSGSVGNSFYIVGLNLLLLGSPVDFTAGPIYAGDAYENVSNLSITAFPGIGCVSSDPACGGQEDFFRIASGAAANVSAPEPASLALLATGLLACGFFTSQTRRTGNRIN